MMRRYVQAWIDGDQETLASFYADDVVMHHQGAGPLTATTRGKQEFFEMVARIFELAPDSTVGEPEFIATADGFAVIRVPEVFKDQEHEFRTDRVVVYRLREGKVTEIWTYDGDQAGMARFYEESARRRAIH
jgi:ketosteroid isomerase-like protein